MCNLYSITKGPQAIRDFARAMRRVAEAEGRRLSHLGLVALGVAGVALRIDNALVIPMKSAN